MIVSIAARFMMSLLVAIGLGSVRSSVLNGRLILVHFDYLPAMWVMISLAVQLVSLAPKQTGLTWIYLTFSFVVNI
ncbi:hypothetical protein [Metabacillus sediminilitoris]|uniref:Uncharacterized protein n=1 Tax=Metabacillus sediminilitoris TaxID=2567941 RepID=A0A4S4BHQ4_9BACI|nr:hypothetical protein [Metabacillus sediminilitoris]QGQ45059.1 hypothetical protein GMB29_07150 [Metabacillus sediminilitoris]THF74093.1 hypothetical protein E6W99_25800 [Metabacillus sediminilitoris]